jgi:hypothetical protein
MDDSFISENLVKQLTIFPNPVADEFVISGNEKMSNVKIYNMQGQLVFAVNGNASVVNVSQLPVGIYQVVAETTEGDLYAAKMLKE